MTRKEMAIKNFHEGFNCSQSIVLAFIDKINIDKDTALRIASPFGGGMGRLRETCGAFSGALIVLGCLKGYSTPETGEIKNALYSKVQSLAYDFENNHCSIVCRDLLGLNIKHDVPESSKRTPEFYQSRPCEKIIGDMAEILDKSLQ